MRVLLDWTFRVGASAPMLLLLAGCAGWRPPPPKLSPPSPWQQQQQDRPEQRTSSFRQPPPWRPPCVVDLRWTQTSRFWSRSVVSSTNSLHVVILVLFLIKHLLLISPQDLPRQYIRCVIISGWENKHQLRHRGILEPHPAHPNPHPTPSGAPHHTVHYTTVYLHSSARVSGTETRLAATPSSSIARASEPLTGAQSNIPGPCPAALAQHGRLC